MAVAGGGVPSRQVWIADGQLRCGLAQNAPSEVVCTNMAIAADLLRKDADTIVRIYAVGDSIKRLKAYLANSGHITAW